MWPFKKNIGNFSVQAQKATDVIIGATEESTPHLLAALVGEERVKANQKLIIPLTSELLIFGIHLTNRIAFSRLGVGKRADFMDALLPAIQRKLRPPVSSQFGHLYNTRNTFYGSFLKFYPDNKENFEGSLFWEFGKVLSSVYGNSNPVAIMQIAMFSMNFTQCFYKVFDQINIFS